MSPCDSNKKNPGWERSHEVLLCLYSNPNPPMQSKIHLCQKISYGNQRPSSFYCCCPKWRYICGHCWAQNYSPWPEVTYIVPEDLIHSRGRFNMFTLYLSVWWQWLPRIALALGDCWEANLSFILVIFSLAEKQWREMFCWSCAAHHFSQAFFIYGAHWVSGNLLLWIGTERSLYNLESGRKVFFLELKHSLKSKRC